MAVRKVSYIWFGELDVMTFRL